MLHRMMRSVAQIALPSSRPRLKLAVRGGIVRLTGDELSVGAGLFGSRDMRRVPLAAITAIRSAEGLTPAEGVTLHVMTADDELTIVGLSPLSARRLLAMLRTVRRPT